MTVKANLRFRPIADIDAVTMAPHPSTMRIYQRVAAAALWIPLLSACDAQAENAPRPLAEVAHDTIGYKDVATALQALRADPNIVFTTQNGWTIATDETNYTIWSIAPEDYPAYPAIVKRQVIPVGNVSQVEMSVHCEASKVACDALVRTFAEMSGMPEPE